jgi:hypothetical protein
MELFYLLFKLTLQCQRQHDFEVGRVRIKRLTLKERAIYLLALAVLRQLEHAPRLRR